MQAYIQTPPLKKFLVDKTGWTPSQHRLWNFFQNSQDSFYKIRYWPTWVQEGIVMKHKSNNMRYKLLLFLLTNGVFPPVALDWVMANDAVGGMDLVLEKYDDDAMRDMKKVLVDHANGSLYKGKYKVFILHTQKVEVI